MQNNVDEHIDEPNDAEDSDTIVDEGPLPTGKPADTDETADIEETESEPHLDEVSPSPALEIEGVVTGEADEGGVQSEGSNFREADASEVHIYLVLGLVDSSFCFF